MGGLDESSVSERLGEDAVADIDAGVFRGGLIGVEAEPVVTVNGGSGYAGRQSE